MIEKKIFYTNAFCTYTHWYKLVLHCICYQGNNQFLLNIKNRKDNLSIVTIKEILEFD